VLSQADTAMSSTAVTGIARKRFTHAAYR